VSGRRAQARKAGADEVGGKVRQRDLRWGAAANEGRVGMPSDGLAPGCRRAQRYGEVVGRRRTSPPPLTSARLQLGRRSGWRREGRYDDDATSGRGDGAGGRASCGHWRRARPARRRHPPSKRR
jgi:hypothetical protein